MQYKMEREEFVEILRTGQSSRNNENVEDIDEMVWGAQVSKTYVKFKLRKEYNDALITLDLNATPQMIYGFMDGIDPIREPMISGFGKKWRSLAYKTIKEIGPHLCN